MLSIRHLAKRLPGPRAGTPGRLLLADLSLDVRAGELVAVMGESGTGKSTLLNLVAGLDAADAGSITLDGLDVTRLDDAAGSRVRRERIGFVFQAFHVLPYLSVAENVAVPLELNRWRRAEADARVAEMLAAVGLAERGAARASELSGGELQRVAIARALAHRPRLVLADEPTGNLDAAAADQVVALLAGELARNGAAGLMVTHSERAARFADRVVTLAGGAIRDGLGIERGDA